ncbi:MAG: sulfatase-like hydrolase/transferase, partial [Planctomycetota bacterium]
LLAMFGDPHWPTVVPEPYYNMYDPADVNLEAADHDFVGQPYKLFVQSRAYDWHRYSDDEKRRILATYYGQVSFVDAQVGRLLNSLDERGLADDTVVCFTSDHGSFAGRFGLVGKTCGFNDTLVRIPLLLRVPGVAAGTRSAMVSNTDVLPTLMELIGQKLPRGLQGRSLVPMLRDETVPGRDAVFAEVNEPVQPPTPVDRNAYDAYAEDRRSADGMFWFGDIMRRGRAAMVRTDRWKFIHYTGDVCELYDLHADPLETANLAADAAHQGQRNAMAARLMDWLLNEPWAQYRADHAEVICDG